MNYLELSPKQVIDYFKSDSEVGIGRFGILYELDYDTLIKLNYTEYMSAFISKKEKDFKREIDTSIELMNYNCNFDRNKKVLELISRLKNTSSGDLIKGIVTNKGYRIGFLLNYYRNYHVLEDKILDYSPKVRKEILKKVREKILELFSVGIYPLDIKEDNVLMSDDMNIKIIDLDGYDVRVEDEEYIEKHPHIKKESENRLIEMEYRLLRH